MHIKIEDILTVTVDAICPSQPGSSPPPRQPAEISCVHLDLLLLRNRATVCTPWAWLLLGTAVRRVLVLCTQATCSFCFPI